MTTARAVGALILLHATTALAGGVEASARAGGALSDHALTSPAGVHVAARLATHWAVGGYAEGAILYAPIVPKCGCPVERERPLRAGALADLHLFPHATFDPWLRLAAGVVRTHRTSADLEGDLGLDLRSGSIAAGPFVSLVKPFGPEQPNLWLGVGVRLVVAL